MGMEDGDCMKRRDEVGWGDGKEGFGFGFWHLESLIRVWHAT